MVIEDKRSGSVNGNVNGNGSQAMNLAELRARRLAALERPSRVPTSIPVSSTSTSTSTPNTTSNSKSNSNSNSSTNGIRGSESSKSTSVPAPSNNIHIETQTQIQTVSSQFISNFNSLMWDDNNTNGINGGNGSGGITTESDKMRWFDQGIHTKGVVAMNDNNNNGSNGNSNSNSSNNLQQQHDAWGLLQSHGGPCGVLAAIQGELITKLNLSAKMVSSSSTSSSSNQLYTQKDIQKGLADSIAHILVRSCMAPSIHQQDNITCTANSTNTIEQDPDGDVDYCVKLILPNVPSQNNEGSLACLDHTMLQCVSIQYNSQSCDNSITTPEAKRVKQTSSNTNSNSESNTYSNSDSDSNNDGREFMMEKLILATSEYLLSNNNDESNNGNIQLEHFYYQGGVMLLTMSLVATRGVDRIKNDMDTGTTHHLTAQFGHSSQELINLLLTGQATTNVFDNSMSLGGSLKMYGIQSQPSIGYLSQLEVFRYCSVGDYYKSPKYPVWVIGSTSHFSVLFGTNDCLKESKSDVLLEQCRRAFKGVDGAEENGFIPVTELGVVLRQLDLDLTESVDTLAASLEMSGAGIILWNDFWKKISRLKTGASLGSVLQDDEEFARQLQAQFESEGDGTNPVSQAAGTTGTTASTSNTDGLNFETYSDHSFQLYHYNGMRGGELTSVIVTRMNPEEVVGADATLVDSSAVLSGNDGAGDDLESVIRTKYPSCMFNWGGMQPPSLH